MLNHKTIFKQKSKILLTIICIFGLAFSYSCSCRSPEKPPTGGNTITPSMSLSRDLMVVNSAGNDTTYKITITVADADFEIADITSEVGLTKDDFTLKDGVLSLTKSFEKLTDNAEKTLTLTVNYKKKSTAGADDTLSKTTDTQTFKIIKAQKLTDDEVAKDLQSLLTVGSFKFSTTKFAISSGIGTLYEKDKVDKEYLTSDFLSQLNLAIKTSTDIEKITGVDFIKVVLGNNDKEATFEFILKVKEQYETTYNEAATPLKLKVVIGDTTDGQGGSGKWKDTSTPQS